MLNELNNIQLDSSKKVFFYYVHVPSTMFQSNFYCLYMENPPAILVKAHERIPRLREKLKKQRYLKN